MILNSVINKLLGVQGDYPPGGIQGRSPWWDPRAKPLVGSKGEALGTLTVSALFSRSFFRAPFARKKRRASPSLVLFSFPLFGNEKRTSIMLQPVGQYTDPLPWFFAKSAKNQGRGSAKAHSYKPSDLRRAALFFAQKAREKKLLIKRAGNQGLCPWIPPRALPLDPTKCFALGSHQGDNPPGPLII